MDDLQKKVIKGLECCRRGFCFSCPYNDGIDENVECKQKWADDALSLLKAQEPRVMTLEEITKTEVVWLECYGICSNMFKAALPRHPININDATWDFETHPYTEVMFLAEYGKNWRCWTSRPTDEQREVIQWN